MWELFLAGIPPSSSALLPGGSNDADWSQHGIFFRGRTFDPKAMKQNWFIPSNLVSHERVLVQTCHVGMCGSERVWGQSLSWRSQTSVPHSQWLTCSWAWPALPCKWLSSARHGTVWRRVMNRRREGVSLRWNTFFFIRANTEFAFALVSATFLSPSDW